MFAGLFCYSAASTFQASVDVETWERVLCRSFAAESTEHWRHDQATIVQARKFLSSGSEPTHRLHGGEGRPYIAFWGRLDNRDDLAERLLPHARMREVSDADLVAEGWRRWGKTLPEHLLGDFALAVVDTDARQLFLARDPLGVKPLYYWPHPQGLLFATTPNAFRCLRGLTPTIDRDWMARYLLHLSMSHDRTGYEEIFKLPGGQHLVVDGEGRQQLQRWHHWRDDAPVADRRDEKWLDAYRETLETAIRCRMTSYCGPSDPNYRLGTENSGGIDSATITAYLAKFLGTPGDRLHSFGFARLEQEPAHILATSQQCHIVHNYLVTAGDQADVEEQTLAALNVLGYPEEHGNGSGHTPFYRECKLRGIPILFSGYGGDEVVTNYGQHVRLELIDRRQFGAVWNITGGNLVKRLLRLGKAVAFGRKQADYNARFLPLWKKRWSHQALRPEVVERLGLEEMYLETARYDAPYRRINDWIINGLLQKPYVPTRLENCTLMAASYGIDYRWPLWDVRLVQQYLSTPAIWKVGPQGIGRYLHRCAITGTVPKLVAWKPSKCMMGADGWPPFGSDAGMLRAAELAQRQDAELHPSLAELIDRAKWREQIQRAKAGNVPLEFSLLFHRTARAIQCLNLWVSGGHAARRAA